MQNQSFYSNFLVYSTHHLEMIISIKNNSFIIIKPPKKHLSNWDTSNIPIISNLMSIKIDNKYPTTEEEKQCMTHPYAV